MQCPHCSSESKRDGYDRKGQQRFRCLACKRTFSEPRPQLLDEMRTPVDKAVQVLRLLLEGNSVRACERLTGISKRAILRLIVIIGGRCKRFFGSTILDVACESAQCDEIWSLVHCKEKTRQRKGYGEEVGDCYTWTAIDPSTKLLLAFAVGKRDRDTGAMFARRLRRATVGHFQINTDGLSIYPVVINEAFGYGQDHAQVVKVFGAVPEGEGRYSPARLIDIHVERGGGDPDLEAACTSHIERSNKTLRMQIRRFTRLTDGHSKLWHNHEAAIALFFTYYDFCRVHSTIKCTPCMKAGLTDHVWSVRELVEKVASYVRY